MTLRVSGKNLAIGESLREHVLEQGRGGHRPLFRWPGHRPCRHLPGSVVVSFGLLAAPEFGRESSGRRARRRSPTPVSIRPPTGSSAGCGATTNALRSVTPRSTRDRRRLTRGGTRLASYTIEAPDEEAEEIQDYSPVIVAEGSAVLKSLSVASAVAELDLTGAPVVVFQHAGSARLNVVYRRGDGAIGWIDPH